jgi:integrase
MSSTKAIIRGNKVNKNGECVIYVRYGHLQKSVDFTIGIKIKPEHWNEQKQLVNSVSGLRRNSVNEALLSQNKKADLHANAIIDTTKSEITRIARSLQQKDIEPTVNKVKEEFLSSRKPKDDTKEEQKVTSLFQQFIDNSNKSRRTILNYGVALYHLKEFEKNKKKTLTLDMMDMKFLDAFNKFLHNEIEKSDKTKGLSINTVGSTIKNLKVFLTYLDNRGYNTLQFLSKIKVIYQDSPIYFLTEDEIKKLYAHDFDTERLEKVRDLFLLNCYLGLRYSDLSRLSKDHIIDDVVQLRAFKNQKDVYIPLTPIPKAILEKYDYEIPRISEQKFNEYIKEACKAAEIDQKVEKIVMQSGNKIYELVPKHKVITSHIAIKTFISLCSKKGISPKVVSEITGKTVKVILKHYYGIDKSTIKDQMKNAFQ